MLLPTLHGTLGPRLRRTELGLSLSLRGALPTVVLHLDQQGHPGGGEHHGNRHCGHHRVAEATHNKRGVSATAYEHVSC